MAAKSCQEGHPAEAFGWAARDQSGVLSPFKFSRRFHLLSLNCFFGLCFLSPPIDHSIPMNISRFMNCIKKEFLLQGNRREGRRNQGAVLWNMSLGPSYDQE